MRSLRRSLIQINFSAFIIVKLLIFLVMYVINDLRLNDFVLVPIPSPKQLFERLGEMSMISPGTSDGEFCEPVNVCSNKLSELEKGQQFAELAYYDSLRQNEPPVIPDEPAVNVPEE